MLGDGILEELLSRSEIAFCPFPLRTGSIALGLVTILRSSLFFTGHLSSPGHQGHTARAFQPYIESVS
jgi:hypothetical protein